MARSFVFMPPAGVVQPHIGQTPPWLALLYSLTLFSPHTL